MRASDQNDEYFIRLRSELLRIVIKFGVGARRLALLQAEKQLSEVC